jgi:hypothetical protein
LQEESDINEHLSTLYNYAKECDHITECGVREVTSSYSFAAGLLTNTNNKLILVDLKKHNNVTLFLEDCSNENINVIFYEDSDLKCPLEHTDLLFIDTWHIYGQLKREFIRWHTYVNKYIILHDTTVDEWEGESIRGNHDINKESKNSGFPIDEIAKGLWPAVEEFLKENPNWKIKERFTNNNGLTVLEKISD